MRKFLQFAILTVFALICLQQTVFAIKCWLCHSILDPACGEPFNNATFAITECNMASDLLNLTTVRASRCRTIKQRVQGEVRYIRGCDYSGELNTESAKPACTTHNSSEIYTEYCTCGTDLCNH